MKKLILTSMFVLVVAVSLSGQDIPFVFDKNRIDVGTVYVYDYSANSENFQSRSKECFYLKTLNDIEDITVPIGNIKATLLTKYKMNWDYMMFENMNLISLKNKNNISIGATFKAYSSIDFSKKVEQCKITKKAKDGFKEHNYRFKLKRLPTYFYNLTDLMPLWFALRFYPLDRKEISVNHNTDEHSIKFNIKYLGKEEVEVPYGKISCYKFELFPKMSFAMKAMFKPKKAWIWLTSEDDRMYMVKYRNNNSKGTFTRNMEYRLFNIKKMTSEKWGEFKEKLGVKKVSEGE